MPTMHEKEEERKRQRDEDSKRGKRDKYGRCSRRRASGLRMEGTQRRDKAKVGEGKSRKALRGKRIWKEEVGVGQVG